jgi:hypothetical protein
MCTLTQRSPAVFGWWATRWKVTLYRRHHINVPERVFELILLDFVVNSRRTVGDGVFCVVHA